MQGNSVQVLCWCGIYSCEEGRQNALMTVHVGVGAECSEFLWTPQSHHSQQCRTGRREIVFYNVSSSETIHNFASQMVALLLSPRKATERVLAMQLDHIGFSTSHKTCSETTRHLITSVIKRPLWDLVFLFVCMHVCVHVHTCMCMCACMNVCTFVNVLECVHSYIHMYVSAHAHVFVSTHMCICCVHGYMYAYSLMCMCEYIGVAHLYVFTHVCKWHMLVGMFVCICMHMYTHVCSWA